MLHRPNLRLTTLLLALAAGLTPTAAAADIVKANAWPRGDVFIPAKLFNGKNKLDKVIMESNPRLYVYPEFDPNADKILIVGMDGWGGRSENFIDTMRLGLKNAELSKRLIVASIQDLKTRGPRFQGQGDRAHANVWSLEDPTIPAMRHFVTQIAEAAGHLRVYFMGYSTGSVAAPLTATRIAEVDAQKLFNIEGAIALGTGSGVSAKLLKEHKQRVLFIVVPQQRRKEYKSHRYDQGNRGNALKAEKRITDAGGVAYFRDIESARRHFDWHWGLMSQCRYYRKNRYDKGRGYWPNYWMPNPDSWGLMQVFLVGKEPPKAMPHVTQKCPHPPNSFNPEDPDAKVQDNSRQPQFDALPSKTL